VNADWHPEGRVISGVAIVTESSINMPDDLVEESGIHVVPLKVIFREHSLSDGIDIAPAEFYEMLAAAPQLPTTSQPSTGDFVEVYRRLSDEAEELREEVLSRFDPSEFYLTELTPALGTHVGHGTGMVRGVRGGVLHGEMSLLLARELVQ
jgi:fatty acid-binding protein DegV